MGSSPHDIVLTFGAGLPSGVFSGTRNRRFYQQPLGYGFGGGDDVTGVDDAGPAADLHLAEPAGGVVGGATSPRSSEEDDSVDT